MVHGGAWTSGDKADDNVAKAKAGFFVAKGYIFVSLNYRLLPKSDPLIQAADVALGIANIQKNASKWAGDKTKIVLMGSGAGGHITALLSSNPSLASDQGATVWGRCGGARDSRPERARHHGRQSRRTLRHCLREQRGILGRLLPTHLVHASGVPILVVCSTENSEQTCAKANAFKQTAENAGVTVTVSPQNMAPWEVNSRVGVSASYTDTIASYIDSLL